MTSAERQATQTSCVSRLNSIEKVPDSRIAWRAEQLDLGFLARRHSFSHFFHTCTQPFVDMN